VVATEIVATLVGSIGLVAAVPLTTWLAVLLAPSTRSRGRVRRARSRRPRRVPAPTVEAAARDESEFWR
jgi:hypothetical protein